MGEQHHEQAADRPEAENDAADDQQVGDHIGPVVTMQAP
jgi:hypothetical protein